MKMLLNLRQIFEVKCSLADLRKRHNIKLPLLFQAWCLMQDSFHLPEYVVRLFSMRNWYWSHFLSSTCRWLIGHLHQNMHATHGDSGRRLYIPFWKMHHIFIIHTSNNVIQHWDVTFPWCVRWWISFTLWAWCNLSDRPEKFLVSKNW